MFVRQYLDEIKLNLLRLNVNKEFDTQTIVTFLNKARRSIQFAIVDVVDSHFTTFINTTLPTNPSPRFNNLITHQNNTISVYQIRLPDNFISLKDVWLQYQPTNDNNIHTSRCRIVSLREFVSTIKNTQMQPLPLVPIAYVEHQTYTGFYDLYIALDSNFWNLVSGDVQVFIYYLFLVSDLEYMVNTSGTNIVVPGDGDYDNEIPPNFRDLVIIQTIFYILAFEDLNYLARVRDEIMLNFLLSGINKNLRLKKLTSLLPSKLTLQSENVVVDLIKQEE